MLFQIYTVDGSLWRP